MTERINEFESAVLDMLLRGDEPVLTALAAQLRECTVESRRYTGAGFFTDFVVPDYIPRVPGKDSFAFGDVVAEIAGLENGAGFLLFVKNGRIAFLEGFSYDEPWPPTIANFKLRYSTGAERDLVELSRQWAAANSKNGPATDATGGN